MTKTMMPITRREALAYGIGAGSDAGNAGYRRTSTSCRVYLQIRTWLSANSSISRFLTAAAGKIRERSGGRFEMQIFGNSQLGGDTQMLSQVRANAIQFFQGGGIILSILVPEASQSGIGFAFSDYDKVWAALDGDVGAYIRGGFEKLGLHPFERMWDNGFRQISTSTGSINTPADLQGLKLRVPPGQLYTSLFQSLGAAPTSINLAETYSALQTKIVSGQENPLVVFNTAKYYEVQKFVSLTSHVWDGVWLFANGKAWAALPEDLQKIVADSLNESGLDQRAKIAATNASLESELAAKGITINKPDPAPFRDKLKEAGFYKEWSSHYAAEGWGALEKYVGKLT